MSINKKEDHSINEYQGESRRRHDGKDREKEFHFQGPSCELSLIT